METTIKLQVSLCENTRGVLQNLAKSLDMASSGVARTTSEVVSTPASNGKTGTKTKNAKTKEPAAPAESEEVDLGFEDEAAAEESEPTFENVVQAFQAYSAKFSRAEAGKILTKFKVKSVKDLKPEQYKDVLKAAKI